MLLNVINPALVDQIMAALSTTFVFSLLQGAALAALAGLVVLLTRKASSATRYNLLIGLLAVFGLASAATFGLEFSKIHQAAAVTAASKNFATGVDLNTFIAQTAPQNVQQNYLANVLAYITAYHSNVVLVWFLIICIKSIQLAAGLHYVRKLRRTAIRPESNDWNTVMNQMAQRLGIKHRIELFESGLAKVPMVLGHLKPIILIPIGLVAALSTAELEAIIMHELAHIRRRDYLVNLLQSLVEIIFFFNPAVLWVSQLIKNERENCCDDMALAHNTSKQSYIQALVSCQKYEQHNPVYTVAFSGQKNTLLNRVKRMVNNRNHSLNTFEKSLLTICLVMSGLCLSAFAERDTIKKTIHKVVKAITYTEDKSDRVEVALPLAVSPVFKPLTIDTVPKGAKKEVPFDEAAWFKKMDSLKKNAAIQFASTPPVAPTTPNSPATPPTPMPLIYADTFSRVITTHVSTSHSITASNKLDIKKMIIQDSVAQIAPAVVPVTPMPPVKSKSADAARALMAEMVKDGLMEKGKPLPFSIDDNAFVVNGKKQSELLAQKYKLMARAGFPDGTTLRTAPTNTNNQIITRIIVQMAKDRIISENDEQVTFRLNNDAFIVNGKKQPDAVFQKYLDEFVKSMPGGKMNWSYTNENLSKTTLK